MFKYMLIGIVFLACTYIGFYLGENYRYRNKELREIRKAIVFLNTEVLYSNTALPKAMFNVSNKIEGILSEIFKETSILLERSEVDSVYEGFDISFIKYRERLHLKEIDLITIRDFFNSLGETGIYGQEKVFEMADEKIKKNCEEAEEEMRTNTKMYRSLGICIGAILAIFFL